MAAPEKTYNQIALDDGLTQAILWVEPQIGGVAPASNLNYATVTINGGRVFEWPGTAGILIGARKPFPTARDLSGSRFIWCSGYTPQFATVTKFADLADGGLRFYITDSAGAYRGWTIYGRDISGTNQNPTFAFGSFLALNNNLAQMWWCIDLDRTPDYSSGTLDLTDIVAIEVHVQNHATITNTNVARFACGYITASDPAIIRGGEVADPASFALLPGTFAAWNTTTNPFYPGGARAQSLTPIGEGANGDVFQMICPVQLGDGSTATYFRQSRGQMAMQLSMEAIKYRIAQGEAPALLPVYLANDSEDCTHTVNQSASDDVEIADFVWSAYDHPEKGYAFEVTGSTSGTCNLIRNSFFRAQFVKIGHAVATDCIFDACNSVEITANTGMTGATIRNAPSGTTALTITGAAGDYSGVDARLNNPSATHDIALGSGGAGTYDLTGITVPSGYTLKLRNNSAANAVTVTIASGITTSTSTAGGAIVVSQPVVRNVASVTNIVAGSRLRVFNETTNTETVNEVVAGTSWTYEYDEGTGFTTGDIINVRLALCTGATAFREYEATAIAGSTGWALFADQDDDEVYNTNGIDGTTITEFTFDYPNIQVDINDPDGSSTITRLYAWWANERTSEQGIRTLIGGLVAEDAANYKVVTSRIDLKLDNTASTGVIFTGDYRLYRDDGAVPVVSSTSGGGSITLYAGKVYTSVISTASPVITGDISDVPAAVQSGMTTQGYTSARASNLENLDAAVSTRNATVPDNAGIAAIKSKTDNLPVDPASNTQVNTRLSSASYIAPANSDIAAIKAKTDVLENPDLTGLALSSEISALNNVSVNDVVSGMQLVADDFKADVSGLSTFNPSVDTVARVTLVDTVTTNTDMRGTDNANTVEPDNSSIAAIKTKTDNLPQDTQSEINSIKKNTNLIPGVL